VVPYLAALGVSHLYLSPIWAARPGSSHGYDVVDHARINPELGGREGFAELAATARAHGLGLILDCVPNHMGIGYDNPWWADVLTWGEASPFAGYFDIDWDSPEPTLAGKVLLPILGDHYGRVLEDGQLCPALDGGRFVVRYFEHTVPIHPREGAELLETALGEARRHRGPDVVVEDEAPRKVVAEPEQKGMVRRALGRDDLDQHRRRSPCRARCRVKAPARSTGRRTPPPAPRARRNGRRHRNGRRPCWCAGRAGGRRSSWPGAWQPTWPAPSR